MMGSKWGQNSGDHQWSFEAPLEVISTHGKPNFSQSFNKISFEEDPQTL